MFKQGDKVKITKLEPANPARSRTATKEKYVCGIDNGDISPFVGYNVEGELQVDPIVGGHIHIKRSKRNGELVKGHFLSSQITKMTVNLIHTENSVYLIEAITI